MAAYADKFKETMKESLMIGGIGAAAVYLGVEGMVARGTDAVGIYRMLGPQLGGAVVVGLVVALSDAAYNVFLK